MIVVSPTLNTFVFGMAKSILISLDFVKCSKKVGHFKLANYLRLPKHVHECSTDTMRHLPCQLPLIKLEAKTIF